jgi:hypothetical protein
VTATGRDLTYHWYLRRPTDAGWRKITSSTPSATTPTLEIKGKATFDGYRFRCIVKNSGGSVTCETATLTIQSAPEIKGQPTDAAVAIGETAHFTVTATGRDLTYHWYLRRPTDAGWRKITSSPPSATTATLESRGGDV